MLKIEEILAKIKEGDSEAFERLLSFHHLMIFKIINHLDRSIGDFEIAEDDLYQEASLALYEAAESFEPERGVKFSTYAYVHIKNNLLNFVKKYRRRYRDDIYSFDASTRGLNFQVSDSTTSAYDEGVLKDTLNRFLDDLSKEDRLILLMRGSNYSYKDIAEKLNMSTKKIDNKLRVLKQRLKKSGITELLVRK